MFNKSTRLALLIFSASLVATSCYRVPVPQGNSLSAASIKRIAVGMSSQEVTSRLGDPVLNNVFANNQLVYVYTYKAQLNPIRIKRLYIYFDHDHVARWVTTDNSAAHS
jgi:outer membrane protein assembly factor BamE